MHTWHSYNMSANIFTCIILGEWKLSMILETSNVNKM